MLEIADALQRLLSSFDPLTVEAVSPAACVGRVLADDIHAPYALPPFPNSAMDGFAVRAADVAAAAIKHPVALPVVGDIPAGRVAAQALQPGQAMRIMTGAPMPQGADAVVPVEQTDVNSRQAGQHAPPVVHILRAHKSGANVRPAGEDVAQGELVLRAGQRLRAQDAGFLNMLGIAQAPVRRRPRVAVFSSGDELLPPGVPLTPGKIHDANTYTLTALIQALGATPINLGIAADDPDAVQALLDQAVALEADLIVSSAGVSVGALDFVRSVVEAHGQLDFWRVNMRPGKPVAFGAYRNTPFIGLPGNPVSAFVTFLVFVRPAVLKMLGATGTEPQWANATLAEALQSDGRASYLRAIVTHGPDGSSVCLTGHQGSGNLRSLVDANALLFVPSGVKSLPSGSQVQVWRFDEL